MGEQTAASSPLRMLVGIVVLVAIVGSAWRFLAAVGQSLLRRHMAIVGGSEQHKPVQEPGRPASQAR